jgi:uncharacterized membrane protein
MTRKLLLFFELSLIVAACVATILVYPELPARVATRWNIHLRPNGYGPKWMLFLIGPGLMTGVMLLTVFGPWLSPKRFEVENFRSTWYRLMFLSFCMVGYLYAAMLFSALRNSIDTGRWILAGVCLAIALMGNVMGKTRKNFFIGVRTPWTLANDQVWNATNRFAARTWMAGGLFGLLFTIIGFRVLSVSALLAGLLAPYAYSFIVYKRFQRRGEV